MKIATSSNNIKSFSWLNFFLAEFDQLQPPVLITKHLGERPPQADFSYSDAIKSQLAIIVASGNCAEVISTNLKDELLQIKNIHLFSWDRLLLLKKSVCPDKGSHLGKYGHVNEFSKHFTLDSLNLDMSPLSKPLQPIGYYDFNFDRQFIPCKKHDSKKRNKMKQVHFPGVHPLIIKNSDINRTTYFKS
jgi:hypothetical protein